MFGAPVVALCTDRVAVFRFSSGEGPRDRNSPIKAHQINLRRSLIGRRVSTGSRRQERGVLLDQLELQLADLEENTAQAETAAQMVTVEKITVSSLRAAQACTPPAADALAARAHCLSCTFDLSLLW